MDFPASWNLRGSYQAAAIEALLSGSGIIQVPAGGGKTIIAVRVIESWLGLHPGRFTLLWLCNTIEQRAQAIEAMRLWSADIRAKLRVYVRCAAGVEALPVPLEDVQLLVIDECHHAAAATWRDTLMGCTNTLIRWGLSATPKRADGLDAGEFIGPILYTVDRQTLEAEGALTVAQVTILRIGEPDSMLQSIADEAKPKIETMFGRMKWTIAAKGENPAELYKIAERRVVFALVLKQIIVENQARQYEIARLATRHIADGDSVLIIVYAIEQGRDLMARIPGARLVFSGMTVKADGRRSDLIQAFKDGVCRCLIATSLADEGLDCPRANVLILAAGGRSTAKSEQRTGRVLRTFAGKTHGVIYDFLDLDHPMASAQSWQRFKTYKKLGYAIQFETVIPA